MSNLRNALVKQQTKVDKSVKARKVFMSDEPLRQQLIEKLRWMHEATEASSTRMIEFDTPSFMKYANEGPRPYHLFVVFTALTAEYRCPHCHQADAEYVPVAQAAWAQRQRLGLNQLPAANASVSELLDAEHKPVFFAIVDIARNRELFQRLNTNQVPLIVILPPALTPKSTAPYFTSHPIERFLPALPMRSRFIMVTQHFSRYDFVNFISQRTGVIIDNLVSSPFRFGDVILGALILGALATGAFMMRKQIMKLRDHRELAVFASWFAYFLFVGGMMYNHIRGVPSSGVDDRGNPEYIMRAGRDQYSVESFIIGALLAGFSVACTAMTVSAFPTVSSKKTSDSAGVATSGPILCTDSAGQSFGLVQLVSKYIDSIPVIALFGSVALLWYIIVDVYDRKQWGYRHGFVWM